MAAVGQNRKQPISNMSFCSAPKLVTGAAAIEPLVRPKRDITS
jgi:hypothetical protein